MATRALNRDWETPHRTPPLNRRSDIQIEMTPLKLYRMERACAKAVSKGNIWFRTYQLQLSVVYAQGLFARYRQMMLERGVILKPPPELIDKQARCETNSLIARLKLKGPE